MRHRDILARSYRCGTENETDRIGNHRPIAVAFQEKFPDVYASGTHIHLFGDERDEDFMLPQAAMDFIHEERMGLRALTFEVALREEVVIAN